jgi:hypothetical protein
VDRLSGRTSNDVDLFIVRVVDTDLHQMTDTPGKYENAAATTACGLRARS